MEAEHEEYRRRPAAFDTPIEDCRCPGDRAASVMRSMAARMVGVTLSRAVTVRRTEYLDTRR
jgi:hypothetical protein